MEICLLCKPCTLTAITVRSEDFSLEVLPREDQAPDPGFVPALGGFLGFSIGVLAEVSFSQEFSQERSF